MDASRVRNLKVISKLKRGQKLNTRFHRFTIDESSVLSFNSVFRFFNGEGRNETVDSVTELIKSSIDTKGLSKKELERLREHIYNAKNGIVCLMDTYKNDCTTVSGLEYVVEMIDDFIGNDPKFTISTKDSSEEEVDYNEEDERY